MSRPVPLSPGGRVPRRPRQRGAALLLAMMVMALVAVLAASMVAQQARAVRVEEAERARSQGAWILHGALDWARLLLREDARNGGADHLGEPWAVPLAEARLSSFLAADASQSADVELEAFLAGHIVDAQSRYNLRNLLDDAGRPLPQELRTLERLCEAAGLPADVAPRLAQAWRAALAAEAGDSGDGGDSEAGAAAPLRPTRVGQLTWLGLEPAVVARLEPLVEVLPVRTPVNVNTASREVLAAVLTADPGAAERLVQSRERSPFSTLAQVQAQLGPGWAPGSGRLAVQSAFFEVHGRVRLGERVLEERSLVERRGERGAEVVVLRRERRSLPAAAPAGP